MEAVAQSGKEEPWHEPARQNHSWKGTVRQFWPWPERRKWPKQQDSKNEREISWEQWEFGARRIPRASAWLETGPWERVLEDGHAAEDDWWSFWWCMSGAGGKAIDYWSLKKCVRRLLVVHGAVHGILPPQKHSRLCNSFISEKKIKQSAILLYMWEKIKQQKFGN